jgi:hypothetical protein
MGHAIEPVTDGLLVGEACSLLDEDEKGSLKGVLGVVVAGQHSPTHSPHHRCMTPHQGREGGGILALDKRV